MKITKTFILFFCLLTFQEVHSQNVYNWYPVTSGTGNNLNYIFYGLNTMWIVGSLGTILRSSDMGYSWTYLNSGNNAELRGFYDIGNKFACGTGGVVLKSTNNGINWILINPGAGQNLNGIARLSFLSLFIAGNSGVLLKSTDLGSTWQTISLGTSVNLNSIIGIGYFGWIAGDNGTIFATTDGGLTWSPQISGVSAKLNYITGYDGNNVCTAGDNGTILTSTNGGATWTSRLSNTTSSLKSISYSSGNWWISGSSGTILHSANGGVNWSIQPGFTSNQLNAIYFFNPDTGITAGNGGALFMRRQDTLYSNYTKLNSNNICSWIGNSGIFDNRVGYIPGFEWPLGTGQDAMYSTGLTIATLYNGSLRMASASYEGEYFPGYIADSSGIPVPRIDLRFKLYNVKRTDNATNNPDWANWGNMVTYGAPFIDVNHNGTYEPNIDTPGVKNAAQTIFLCMTDGFIEKHIPYEGFGGGTLPLFAEVHMTAWCYNNPDLSDVQFIKWDVINKSHTQWQSFYSSVVCDPDLGCSVDDFIGCDTTRSLGYCYNGEEVDCPSNYRYSGIVPSIGIQWLRCGGIQNPGMTSFAYFACGGCNYPVCETDPNPDPQGAYNFMKGLKKDATPWVIPPGGQSNITRYCYSGDPYTGTGWCEAQSMIKGRVENCGGPGITTGNIISSNSYGDRRMIINSGSNNLTVNAGDTQKIIIAQLIARGNDRRSSVTFLKTRADTVFAYCSRGYIIGVDRNQSKIVNSYSLYQNYPNPFNLKTQIFYELPEQGFVKLVIYDVLGREVQTLVNEKQQAGGYKADWDGTNFASGIYFYKLTTGDFEQTKKMVLLK